MNKAVKMVIYSDKKISMQCFQGFLWMLAGIALISGGLFSLGQIQKIIFFDSYYLGSLLLLLTKPLLYLYVGWFLFFIIYFFPAYFSLLKGELPVVIFDDNGMWVVRYGHIPWTEICDFVVVQKQGNSDQIESIVIVVKNLADVVSKKSAWSIRLMAFLGAHLGCHINNRITLLNLDRKNHDILSFSQKYVKNCHDLVTSNQNLGEKSNFDEKRRVALVTNSHHLKVVMAWIIAIILFLIIAEISHELCSYFSYQTPTLVYLCIGYISLFVIKNWYLAPENT